ncbi:Molybdenum storage protein subunit beta [Anaerolineales bacterium]|nr:Molybdenum storage protein subunit beta [Anaerolineales bacterium]
MSIQRDASGRLQIESPLMGESLMDKALLASTDTSPIHRLMPDLVVVKVGGQSIIDRGRTALLPILDELVEARKSHKILIATGGGTRARHAYAIATDLGMPTGVLAKLGSSISEQNALMIAILLSQKGGIKIGHDDLSKLPNYFMPGILPVTHAMPPYGLFESPPLVGRIPPHRTDVGAFLLAEVMGAERCVLIKDEKGLYTADPKKDPSARFIEEIDLSELLAMDLNDLAVERSMLESLQTARSVREVFIVNGLVPGSITQVLNGRNVGTRIYVK